MATIGWNNVGRSSGSGNGDNKVPFLKIFAGGEVIVRPVGEPKELIKYFVKINPSDKGRGAITDGGKNCVIQKKYIGEDGKPLYRQQTKYAFNVIDRTDGQLRFLRLLVLLLLIFAIGARKTTLTQVVQRAATGRSNQSRPDRMLAT